MSLTIRFAGAVLSAVLLVSVAGCARRRNGAEPVATGPAGEAAPVSDRGGTGGEAAITAGNGGSTVAPEAVQSQPQVQSQLRFVPVPDVEQNGLPLTIVAPSGNPPSFPATSDGMEVVAVALADEDVYAWFVTGDRDVIDPTLEILDIIAGVRGPETAELDDRYVREVATEAAGRFETLPAQALLIREADGVYQLRVSGDDQRLICRIYLESGRVVDLEWYEETWP